MRRKKHALRMDGGEHYQCSLCGKDVRRNCETCGHTLDEVPVMQRIKVYKREPALHREEVLDLCRDCQRRIFKVFEDCKADGRGIER